MASASTPIPICAYRRIAAREFDAAIVGGGPAGLSAALVLGRARKRVLVLDTGRPANAAAAGSIGGLLGQSGVAPFELRTAGREQLGEHPNVEFRDVAVVDARRLVAGFEISLGDGSTIHARALLLAHGLRYDPPALPGIDQLWGRSVFHCPFCDGWEVRERRLALHANGPDAVKSALVIAGWSDDVVVCTDGPARLGPGRVALEQAGIRVNEAPIRALSGHDGRLQRIEFDDGSSEPCDALFVRTMRGQPNELAEALGCELTAGGTIVTDEDGRTGVPGLYAAGDAATAHSRSVANAVGSGSRMAYAVATDAVEARTPQVAAA